MDRKEAAGGSSSFSGCTNTLQLRFNVSIHESYLPRIPRRRNAWEEGGEGWRTNICLHLTGLMMVGRVEGFIARLGCTKVASHRRRAGKRKHGRITRLVVVSKPVRFGKVASLSLSYFGSLFNSVLQFE